MLITAALTIIALAAWPGSFTPTPHIAPPPPMRPMLPPRRTTPAVHLTFQLVGADYTNERDPRVSSLDSLVRGVMKYSGYRLFSTVVASVSALANASQTMSAGEDDYRLTYTVTDIVADGPDPSLRLNVELRRLGVTTLANGARVNDILVFSTSTSVPIGHMAVLGSSIEHARPIGNGVAMSRDASTPAMISNNVTGTDRALVLTVLGRM
jgi:hypothetical protein